MATSDEQATSASGPPASPLWRTISLLGIAQIISWGSLYYSLTVLALPIRHELGFSEVMIFGAFTLGQLASGVAAPIVGRIIDRSGGRTIMTAGSLTAALAMTTVALAQGPVLFAIGWILAGVATAACLYDPAFATLFQIAPDRYRRSVTGLTLFGGFASTVFWPLSHALAETWGWRNALLTFALLHLLICVPIHHFALPASADRHLPKDSVIAPGETPKRDSSFAWLAASFASATFVFSALSAYMVGALNARGFTVEQAVWIGALIGPMQVLARVIEWMFAGRISAIGVGFVAYGLGLAGVALLNVIPGAMGFGVLFAICYGASNGILTIARGTVPVELFGSERQGALLGTLARPSFFTKAFAPALFAAGISAGVSMRTGVAVLAAVSAVGLLCFYLSVSRAPSRTR